MPEINRRQAMVPAGARGHRERAAAARPGCGSRMAIASCCCCRGRRASSSRCSTRAGRRAACAHAPPGAPLVRRVVKIAGRIESQTEEALQPLYREWAQATPPIAATILAALGQIELHLSARAASRTRRRRRSTRAVAAGERGAWRRRLQHRRPADRSRRRRPAGSRAATASRVAESCTGGLITSRLTDVPGSSRYVDRAVVAYANEAKIDAARRPAGADRSSTAR